MRLGEGQHCGAMPYTHGDEHPAASGGESDQEGIEVLTMNTFRILKEALKQPSQ